MYFSRRRVLGLLPLAASAIAASAHSQGASFPTRPVTLVVPFPAGGAADTLGRILGKHLADRLGQAVVVDNKPGAGTMIGAGFVARAPADGHTLLLASGSTMTVNPVLRDKLPYDPLTSFEPIGLVGNTVMVLLANPRSAPSTLAAVVSAAKSRPGALAYASFGNGTISHFSAEMFKHAAGIDLLHVAYKGSAPAMADLIGGQVPLAVDTVVAAVPQVRAGKVAALVTMGSKRSIFMPNVPTLEESGYPGVHLDSWIGLFAPAGTPPVVRQALEKALAGLMKDPAVGKQLQAAGIEPAYAGAAQAASTIQRELPQMRAIAARAGIQAE